MPIVQHQLAFARPLSSRVRSVRRPFRPSRGEGAYRLPHDVRDRLSAALAPFRNRDAAFALATFLARFWSVPGRVALPFPIDRRALAEHQDLDLSEARVRGAIRVLEEVGFLARFVTSGSRYKATVEGLRRKPVPFQFGADYFAMFDAANQRAGKARAVPTGGDPHARRPITPAPASRPSVAVPEARSPQEARPPKSPKNKSKAESLVIMGELRKPAPRPPQTFTPLPQLSAAALKVFGKPKRA